MLFGRLCLKGAERQRCLLKIAMTTQAMRTFPGLVSLLLGMCSLTVTSAEDIVTAKAYISPSIEKSDVPRIYGTVYMAQKVTGGDTTFRVRLSGLNANHKHGFHVHAFGDVHNKTRGCEGAGPHYNPFGRNHGGRSTDERHIGDLGNLQADASGDVDVSFLHDVVSLVGEYSITGRSFVVHEDEDDIGRGQKEAFLESKRNGNSGTRLACGHIYFTANAVVLPHLNSIQKD